MKALLYPSDATGCGNSRMYSPAKAAMAEGVDVEFGTEAGAGQGIPLERAFQPLATGGVAEYVRLTHPLDDVDLVIFQRAGYREIAEHIIPALQARGIAVVVEMDDDMASLHPQQPSFGVFHPRLNQRMNWEWMRKACARADLVTVTCQALADRYGAHGRVAVLPNCVPERALDVRHRGDGHTVGWGGWTITHPGDLAVTAGGVTEALTRAGGRYLQVGPHNGVQEQLGLPEEPECTGGLPAIDDYYRALSRLDVGIAPLADTRFNAAKSYLKPLEMAAVGAVPVMSPRAEYVRLHEQGVGVLAGDRARDWRRAIEGLLTDADGRQELAEVGREVVRAHHTYEDNGWRWAEAWQSAVARRQSLGTKAAA